MTAAALAAAAPGASRAVLLPYQQRLVRDKARRRLVNMSRRVGKSWTLAWEAVDERLSGENARDLIYTAHRENSAREFINYAADFVRQVDAAADIAIGEALVGPDNIRVLSVSIPMPDSDKRATIYALSGNPDAVRGFQGDVILDEYAFRRDPAKTYKAAVPLLTWGGRLTISSTWKGAKSQWAEFVAMAERRDAGEAKPADLEFSHHRVTLAEAVEQGLVERINAMSGQALTREQFLAEARKDCRTESDWLEEFCCAAGDDEESFFPYEMLRQVVSHDDAAPTDSPVLFARRLAENIARLDCSGLYFGADIGRVSDLFVFTVRARVAGRFRTVGTLAFTGRTFGEMESAIEQTLRASFVNSRGEAQRIRRGCVDASGLGMQLAERLTERFPSRVEGVTFTLAVKEDLVTRARRHLDEKTITLPDDPATLGHWNAIRRTITAAGHTRYDGETDTGHADLFWADALCIHAADSRRGETGAFRFKGGMCG